MIAGDIHIEAREINRRCKFYKPIKPHEIRMSFVAAAAVCYDNNYGPHRR